jgi:hypothetical protein
LKFTQKKFGIEGTGTFVDRSRNIPYKLNKMHVFCMHVVENMLKNQANSALRLYRA